MPLTFISENIIQVAADAIVTAANAQLRAGGGVCGEKSNTQTNSA